MDTKQEHSGSLPDPHAQLEQEFIKEYLHDHLAQVGDVASLSAEARRQLLVDASRFASVRLAELETRAHLVNAVHGAVKPGQLG